MKRELRYSWKDTAHSIDEEKLNVLSRDFEIDFFESVLEKDPDHIPALVALGELYTAAGQFRAGLEVDLKLVELYPYEPVVQYNLACSLSLLEKVDEAVDALRKAINLGYEDFETLQNDADLENIRSHPKFIELLLNVKESS